MTELVHGIRPRASGVIGLDGLVMGRRTGLARTDVGARGRRIVATIRSYWPQPPVQSSFFLWNFPVTASIVELKSRSDINRSARCDRVGDIFMQHFCVFMPAATAAVTARALSTRSPGGF